MVNYVIKSKQARTLHKMTTDFEKLLSDPTARADAEVFKRHVYPSGRYSGTIVDTVFGETKPRDKDKPATPFVEVSAKIDTIVSVEPHKIAQAKTTIEHSNTVVRTFYITQKAFPMWTEFLCSINKGDQHPIQCVANKTLVGVKVMISLTEEKSERSDRTYNPADGITFAGIS